MKYVHTFIFAFCLQIYGIDAQNILFFNFGERYEKVIENLNKFPVDSTQSPTTNKPLTAYYDGFIAKYYFNLQEKLYKIEVSKNYELKKNAKDAVSGAIDYFDKIRAGMSTANVKGTKVYRAKRKEHYYEMQEVFYADNDIDVFLVGWSGSLAPEAWIGGEVVSEDDILDVHDVRLAQRNAKEENGTIITSNNKNLPILAGTESGNNDNTIPLAASTESSRDKAAFAHLRIANNTELRADRNKKTESLTKAQDISIERIIVEEDKSEVEARLDLSPGE